MTDEELWKKRYLVFTVARLFGLALIVLGVAVGISDVLRPGGWPAVGFAIALMGAIDALLSPRLLKKKWEEEDRQKK